jgi:hypothetical protein
MAEVEQQQEPTPPTPLAKQRQIIKPFKITSL